jgi:hypothetical protein
VLVSLMPVNDRDLQALHYLAKRIRSETMGAGEWHDAGISAVLGRMKGHNLALTIERVTRHAADPEARTPAAIERPFTPDPPGPQPARPPKPADACTHCGRERTGRCCDRPSERPAAADRATPTTGWQQARRSLTDPIGDRA